MMFEPLPPIFEKFVEKVPGYPRLRDDIDGNVNTIRVWPEIIVVEATFCEILTVQVVPLPPVMVVPGRTPNPIRGWPIAIVPPFVGAPEDSVVPEIEPVNFAIEFEFDRTVSVLPAETLAPAGSDMIAVGDTII